MRTLLLPVIENTFLKPTVIIFLYLNIPKTSFKILKTFRREYSPVYFLFEDKMALFVYLKRYFNLSLFSHRLVDFFRVEIKNLTV